MKQKRWYPVDIINELVILCREKGRILSNEELEEEHRAGRCASISTIRKYLGKTAERNRLLEKKLELGSNQPSLF